MSERVREAPLSVEELMTATESDEAGAARRYAEFVDGQLRSRQAQLVEIRAALAAQRLPDPLMLTVFGAGPHAQGYIR